MFIGLFIILSILLALFFTEIVQAAGTQYTGVKTISCTNATEREDGTALPPAEIERVEIGFTKNADGTGSTHFTNMPGGCADKEFDLSLLPSIGQWYEVGWTVACDNADWSTAGCTNELYSKPSAPVAFVVLAPAPQPKARPMPPVLLK